jgi:TP901 family phage tail tape measure protein
MSALREVLALFSVDVDSKALNQFEGKISSVMDKVQKAGAIFVEAFAVKAISEFFNQQIEGAAHLEDTAEKLGLTTDALQRFAYAASSAGVDADSSAQSLGKLNKSIGEAVNGGGEAGDAFTKLGVQVKDAQGKVRPVEDVLLDVADGFKGLGSQQERAAYSMKIFGREGQKLLPVISQGADHIRDMYKEADELGIIMGGDFYKNAKAAREEISHFGMVTDSFKARILSAALPAITALFKWFLKIAKPVQEALKHSNALAHGLEFLAIVAGVKLIPTVIKLFKLLGGFQTLGIVAGVTALYVAFDDVMTMIEGGDSVLGDFLDKLGPGFKTDAIQGLRDTWDAVTGAIKAAGAELGLFSVNAKVGLPDVLGVLMETFKVLGGIVVAATGLARIMAHLNNKEEMSKIGSETMDSLFGQKGIFGKEIYGADDRNAKDDAAANAKNADTANRRATALASPVADPEANFAGLPSYALDNSAFAPSVRQPLSTVRDTPGPVTNNHTFNVTVEGGKGAKETGKAIAEEAAHQFENYNTLQSVARP